MNAASTAAAAPAPAATVQVPRGQVDLIDFIDWTGVECLNQDSSHSIVNALKQVGVACPPTQTRPRLAPFWDSNEFYIPLFARFWWGAVRLVFSTNSS
jgi:hypothetical protein